MKTKSTPVKKPLLTLANGQIVKEAGIAVRNLSSPTYIRKVGGVFCVDANKPKKKPYFTFHSEAQVQSFLKLNNKK